MRNAVNKNLEITFERMLAKVEEIGIRWTKMFVTFIKQITKKATKEKSYGKQVVNILVHMKK